MISHYYIGSLWLILSYCFEARGDWIAPHQGTQLKKKRLNLDFCVEAMGEEAAQLIINAFVAPGQKLCLSRVSRARGMDQKLWQLWYHIDPYNLRDEHSFIYILIYQLDVDICWPGDCMAFHMFSPIVREFRMMNSPEQRVSSVHRFGQILPGIFTVCSGFSV